MRSITDLGYSPTFLNGDGTVTRIGRYGVWDDAGRRNSGVIATGDDLEALQAEFGPDLPVIEFNTVAPEKK